MRFPIRPGKVTCAGIVAILMVLPNSIWKGPDANVARPSTPKVEARRQTGAGTSHSLRVRVKLREVPR
jgi:hypothetical protein